MNLGGAPRSSPTPAVAGVRWQPRCPQRRLPDVTSEIGSPRCLHCGDPISAGELFIPAGTSPAVDAGGPDGAGAHLRCAAGAYGEAERVCYTFGHGTRSEEELEALLRENEIQLVADIRTVPKSRHNPQSAGEALARRLPESGICYLYLPGLGGFRKPRKDSSNDGWRNRSFQGYADYMLTPEFEAALGELMELLPLFRTALMCSETVYWRCHRSLVADALLIRGVPSRHILQPGKVVLHTLTRFARPEGTQLYYPPAEPGQFDSRVSR